MTTIRTALVTILTAALLVELEWEMKLRKAAALSAKGMIGIPL